MNYSANGFVLSAGAAGKCPVTNLTVHTLQDFVNINLGGDYYISLYKIGEQIVFVSSTGNLCNYDVEPFNEIMRKFCLAAKVKTPYLQISDITHVKGRIPLSTMQKQAQSLLKQQNSLAGIVTINDPKWMRLLISYGVRLFSPTIRLASVKNYSDALHAAMDILEGKKATSPKIKPAPFKKFITFDDIKFDPQLKYENRNSGFIYKMGIIPGKLQYSAMYGYISQAEDVLESASIVQMAFELNPLTSKSFIVVDLTNLAGHTPFHLKQLFAKKLAKVRSKYDLTGTTHVVVSSSNFIKAAAKVFFSFLKQRVITANNTEEAFQKINSVLVSDNSKNKSNKAVTISKADLDEIIRACGYLLWDKEGEAISVETSPENPLFEIAEILELVKTDLNEQRIIEKEKSQQRLHESENTRRQLLSMMEDTEAAKEALLKTKAEMTAIIENTLDSIWSVNTNYEIIYINEVFTKAYEAAYGIRLKPGSKILDTASRSAHSLWKERYDRVLNGEHWVIVDKYDTQESSSYIEVSAHPIYNNDKVIGASLFGRNITERIHAEETRQQLEVVKNTVQIKQNFLANMSHEIRTPLTGVLGMLEILEQTRLDEHQKDYLQTLKTSGKHLKQIIDQVLDYSKIEAGKVQINPAVFSLNNIIKHSLLLYENTLNQGVRTNYFIDPQIPVLIEADEFRLSQIVNNLLSNAVKFTRKGLISTTCKLIAIDNQQRICTIRIEIADTGPGIPDHLHQNLFTPFSQIEVSDIRKYEGTGLGLSICRELIKLMGGEMGMKSEEGKGSTFWITFPATIADETHIPDLKKVVTEPEKSLNILLAEDKVINQKVIKLMLSSLGHELQIACNGQVALDKFEPRKFDLILMDIQMPVMDGVAATQKLKEKFDDLPPIVGLSANAFEGDREKYMALGMDEYLTKPVKKEDFEGLIKKLFLYQK
jgi:signal transduction histidine kinase